MQPSFRVLAVIPARGGSKGVPRKNLRLVCGTPLIAFTIGTALAARRLFYRTIVSTDDNETAEVARRFGADVPFLRPAMLAGDTVPMVDALRHAVRFVEQQDGVTIDWVCLLQPTAPLRTVEDIANCLERARQGDCDSVISIVQVFAHHPALMKRIEEERLVPFCVDEPVDARRQDHSPAAYMRNGAVYVTRRDVIVVDGSMSGRVSRPYIMPQERSVNVDTELDLLLLERLLQMKRL